MQLQQIKIEVVPEQDRLLLRLASGDNAEILLWLTRRCVRLLWPLLVKMAESAPRIALQPTPEARQALLDMERERALAKADFSSPYKEDANRARPLGADPLLIARINIGVNSQGNHVLTLRPTEGQGVNIAMDDTLLHGFCKVLQDAVEKAQWDMKLMLPTAPVPGSADGVPRTLN
jgi:hypothetical protein